MKKLITVILLLAMLLGMAGCASMLRKEYYEVSDYVEETTDSPEDTGGGIKNYKALLRAINRLVVRHDTDGRLTFSGYEGDISDDLASACWEIKNNTPMGAFSVDYMSYDLSRIVSYYEADIYITYRRTKTQVESIVNLSMTGMLQNQIQAAMKSGESYVLASLNTLMINEETVKEYVWEIYTEEQLRLVSLPKVTVNIYPDSGSEKIFEISFDYGFPPEEVDRLRAEQTEAVGAFVTGVPKTEDQSQQLYQLCRALDNSATYDPDSSGRLALAGRDNGLGATAYGVFVDGLADSRGFAMAVKLLCQLYGIECMPVGGQLDSQTHWWNIVNIGGDNFHIDVTHWSSAPFLRSDDTMHELGYSWDISRYPVCASGDNGQSITPADYPAGRD